MAVPDGYDQRRRDARQAREAFIPPVGRWAPRGRGLRDEQIEAQRQEIARLRVLVTRVIDIPREPDPQPDDDEGFARGWAAVIALVDKALRLDEGQT